MAFYFYNILNGKEYTFNYDVNRSTKITNVMQCITAIMPFSIFSKRRTAKKNYCKFGIARSSDSTLFAKILLLTCVDKDRVVSRLPFWLSEISWFCRILSNEHNSHSDFSKPKMANLALLYSLWHSFQPSLAFSKAPESCSYSSQVGLGYCFFFDI